MLAPGELSHAVHDPAFWARFFFYDDETGTPVPDAVVDFPVGGGWAIELDVDADFNSYNLGIYGPTCEVVRSLGWDDMAQQHPYALRWPELDLICRAVSVVHPALPHPGVPMALLCRFASVQDGDDVDAIVATLDAAFSAVRPSGWTGAWPTAEQWLTHADFRGKALTWGHDAATGLDWVDGDPHDVAFYTKRTEPVDHPHAFPYAALRALLDAAAQSVAGHESGAATA